MKICNSSFRLFYLVHAILVPTPAMKIPKLTINEHSRRSKIWSFVNGVFVRLLSMASAERNIRGGNMKIRDVPSRAPDMDATNVRSVIFSAKIVISDTSPTVTRFDCWSVSTSCFCGCFIILSVLFLCRSGLT